MSAERMRKLHERAQGAIDEIESLIRGRYPEASFEVAEGDDPEGIYLRATVDIDDVDEVMDVYRDRLLEMQIDEGLELYVIPLEPIERVMATMRARRFAPRTHKSGEPYLTP